MNQPIRVIRSEEILPFYNSNRRARPPGVALVGQTRDGQLEQVTRVGAFSRYRRIYEVDVVAHEIDLSTRLPTQGDAYFFEGRVKATWQVHEPVAAVRNNISDVAALVGPWISRVAGQVAHRFKIEQSIEAEHAVNEELRKIPLVFDEGFTIVQCFVQLSIDSEAARAFLNQREWAHRNTGIGSADIAAADPEDKIKDIHLKYELEQRETQLQAVRRALLGDNDFLYMHLAKNPSDTGRLVDMIIDRDRIAQRDRRALLQDLLDRGFIQDSDIGLLREAESGDTSPTVTRGPASNPPETSSGNTDADGGAEARAATGTASTIVADPPSTAPTTPPEVVDPPTRYLTAHMPDRVATGRTLSLIVQITTAVRAGGPTSALRDFDVPADGATVTVIVSSPGLVPRDEVEHDILVPPHGDSEPCRFGFIAAVAGLHVVTVDAYRGGTHLGAVRIEVSVEVGARASEGRTRIVELSSVAFEPGEVTLQVSRGVSGYTFQLLGDPIGVPVPSGPVGDVDGVVNELARELSAMAANASAFDTPALIRQRLENLGVQLWSTAIPQAVRDQYWEQSDRITGSSDFGVQLRV